MPDAEHVVDNLEALVALGEVDGRNVHDTLELALRVITEEGENRDDRGGPDVERKFVLEDGELLDELGQALEEVRPKLVQRRRRLGVERERRVGRRGLGERGLGRRCAARGEPGARRCT